jgi:spore germination cell wall hydrolase CwlJ-like protein
MIVLALASAAALAQLPSDTDYVVKTACAEARGLSQDEMAAVAHVIINRYERGGYDSFEAVVLERGQFNVWRAGKVAACGRETEKAERAVREAIDEQLAGIDPTRGATHFHNQSVRPKWTKRAKDSVRIGAHTFYRL